jgi:hypothetical protein
VRLHRNVIAAGFAIIAVGILAAGTFFVTGWRNGASAQTGNEGRTVTVDGYGTIEVEPDSATLHFAIEGEGESEEAARDAAASRADEVVAALQNQGVAEDALTVSEIEAVQGKPDDEDETSGYLAFAHISAELDDPAQAQAIIDAVTTATGVERAGVEYSVSEDSPAWQEAREAALEDARAQAEDLAELFGSSLGEAINVRQTSHPGGEFGFAVHPGGPHPGTGWSTGVAGGWPFPDGSIAADVEQLAAEIEERFGEVPNVEGVPFGFAQGGAFANGASQVSVMLTVTWELT